MAGDNFFEGIKTEQDLKNKLIKNVSKHDYYMFYTNDEIVDKTLNNGIRLTNGVNWNDLIDRQNLNKDGKIRFVKCFTYSKSENVVMWFLYGASNNGCLVKYVKSQILSLLTDKNLNIEIKSKKGLTEYSVKKLNREDFDIELIDVVYVGTGDDDESLALKKSIYGENVSKTGFSYDIDNGKLDYYAKTYGWAYENECRLVISIDSKKLQIEPDKEYFIDLKISEKSGNKYKYPIIVLSPFYKSEKIKKYTSNFICSNYTGKISWNFKNSDGNTQKIDFESETIDENKIRLIS